MGKSNTPPRLLVRVPASTSNLGPGFDCLGLALSLFLEVRLEGPGAGSKHVYSFDDEETERAWSHLGPNLLGEAFDHARRRLEADQRSFAFRISSEIPIARGLGSSGAARVAGLLLGASTSPRHAGEPELLRWAMDLEGHPDNVAPALLGGCRAALPHPAGGAPLVVEQELHEELFAALAWPDEQVTTASARAALPPSVPFEDAVENPRRLALLLEGLRTADPELLRFGCEDRLHVAHRLALIPGGAQALEAAREAGAWLATVSGSGSALVALASESLARPVAEAMAEALRRAAGSGTARTAVPVRDASRVVAVSQSRR